MTEYNLKEGDVWYKISKKWVMKWYLFSQSISEEVPGKIFLDDNENMIIPENQFILLEKEYQAESFEQIRVCKNNIVSVPEMIFDKKLFLNVVSSTKDFQIQIEKTKTVAELKEIISNILKMDSSLIELVDQIENENVKILNDKLTLQQEKIFNQTIRVNYKTKTKKFKYEF